jgi:hypothetical protein
MQQTKSRSGSCVLKSPRTETQEADLHGSPMHYFSCESCRAIETVECIVTNSLGFVLDAILRSKTLYPESRTARDCCRSLFVI